MIVVISQSATNQPQLRDYEEQLVTYLLLEAQCEVNLVPDLALLDQDSTGLLCLEGIKGDMLVVSWHDSQEAHALLDSHGIRGRLAGGGQPPNDARPDPLGPGVYDAMQRTVHHLQLDLHRPCDHYAAHIKSLSHESTIQTVTLAGPAPPVGLPSDEPDDTPEVASADPAAPAADPHPVTPVPKRSSQYVDAEVDDGQLDALLDRLDNSDL